uniref:C2 domain-containing protein n=1 Tax=Odontella aurita TaxID=265563 RepID=A0A7S4N1Z9_9STRA|mmetsp:Transcript_44164/g.134468  ORF Transcript_44164/g.134468 Transcript_44164/m.134468 type:complete len:711 (+) Transcript_44164:668-2800(+)
MAFAFLVAALKPFVIIWAGLNAIDDFALLMRASRLLPVLVPGRGGGGDGGGNSADLCDVCDDVMGDLLKSDGLSAVPCSWACLKLPACVKMCESVQESAATSTKFPCVAAGYCDASDDDSRYVDEVDPESCEVGRFFSCEPKRYCRRRRRRGFSFKFTCELRPGIGRWVGLKRSAAELPVAVAEGLMNQKNCGEEDAGPYCIARPTGWGVIAEATGHVLSLLYGGYRSVVAIETPGGDDDQQWLTFWVMLTAVLFVEQYFARTLLSTCSFYYQAKLVVLLWLLYRGGAEAIYRRLRRTMLKLRLIKSDAEEAEEDLATLKALTGGVLEEKRTMHLRTSSKDFMTDTSTAKGWREERWMGPGPMEELYLASRFLLSAEGSSAMARRGIRPDDRAVILEKAAAVVSFQPRFVLAKIYGTWSEDEARGELPPMDRNGQADPYVTCRLIPGGGGSVGGNNNNGSGSAKVKTIGEEEDKNVGEDTQAPEEKKKKTAAAAATAKKSTTIRYGTIRPQWNETLELSLNGGIIGPDGTYRNSSARTTSIVFEAKDADVGRWGMAFRLFEWTSVILVMTVVAAYANGTFDDDDDGRYGSDLLRERRTEAVGIAAIVLVGLVVSYVMAVVRRSDDEVVGMCAVPLEVLLDQSERTLLLTLQKLPSSLGKEGTGKTKTKTTGKKGKKDAKAEDETEPKKKERTNSAGGLGVLRVKLWLSED